MYGYRGEIRSCKCSSGRLTRDRKCEALVSLPLAYPAVTSCLWVQKKCWYWNRLVIRFCGLIFSCVAEQMSTVCEETVVAQAGYTLWITCCWFVISQWHWTGHGAVTDSITGPADWQPRWIHTCTAQFQLFNKHIAFGLSCQAFAGMPLISHLLPDAKLWWDSLNRPVDKKTHIQNGSGALKA